MSQQVTIVMYHYVRDRRHSRFPELKCLDFADFTRQLDYLEGHYTVVSAEAVADALAGGPALPQPACLLTFDDGYLDHYVSVFPELARRGLSGAFYPPVLATQRQVVMEVNKIQLILAANGYAQTQALLARLADLYRDYRRRSGRDDLPDFQTLYAAHARPSRYDGPEVMCLKALLQYALPQEVRTELIDSLFAAIVGTDERMLAQELYLSLDMLRVMARNGMHIGSHGDRHRWLDKLPPAQQRDEIDASLALLGQVHGTESFVWSMCYPFGGVDGHVQELCAARGCAFGLVTRPGAASLDPAGRFTLSRSDTNEIPLA